MNSGNHHIIRKLPCFLTPPSLWKMLTLCTVSAEMHPLYQEGLLLQVLCTDTPPPRPCSALSAAPRQASPRCQDSHPKHGADPAPTHVSHLSTRHCVLLGGRSHSHWPPVTLGSLSRSRAQERQLPRSLHRLAAGDAPALTARSRLGLLGAGASSSVLTDCQSLPLPHALHSVSWLLSFPSIFIV